MKKSVMVFGLMFILVGIVVFHKSQLQSIHAIGGIALVILGFACVLVGSAGFRNVPNVEDNISPIDKSTDLP